MQTAPNWLAEKSPYLPIGNILEFECDPQTLPHSAPELGKFLFCCLLVCFDSDD